MKKINYGTYVGKYENIFLICKFSYKILSRAKVIIVCYGIYSVKNCRTGIECIVTRLLNCILVIYFMNDYDKVMMCILNT